MMLMAPLPAPVPIPTTTPGSYKVSKAVWNFMIHLKCGGEWN